MFPKRNDAKAAVCLQAMSQGACKYIRFIGEKVENKVSTAMREFANDQIFPTIVAECTQYTPGHLPTYEFDKDRDGKQLTSIQLVENWVIHVPLIQLLDAR